MGPNFRVSSRIYFAPSMQPHVNVFTVSRGVFIDFGNTGCFAIDQAERNNPASFHRAATRTGVSNSESFAQLSLIMTHSSDHTGKPRQ